MQHNLKYSVIWCLIFFFLSLVLAVSGLSQFSSGFAIAFSLSHFYDAVMIIVKRRSGNEL